MSEVWGYARSLDVGRTISGRTPNGARTRMAAGRRGPMSAFEDHKEEIEHYEQMLGAHRGRLAVTLDRVTNAMVLVGQHGVYCHSHPDPAKPTMDIHIISQAPRPPP